MRPIDGDNLEEQIIKLQEDTDCYQNPSEVTDVLDYVLQLLDNQPTIEADPVVHGRWQLGFFNNAGRKVGWCSNCGALEEDKNYCPNCGAKMDRGDQNE